MDDEKNEAPILSMLLRSFAATFTWATLAMCAVGMLAARRLPAEAAFMPVFFDSGGMPFAFVLQLAGFSLVMSFFAVLLFSERFFARMRYFWRAFFLCLATLAVCSAFSMAFGWFPVGYLRSWIVFALATVSCFALSFALLQAKRKLEGKKYDRLLANYKARRARK